MSIVPQPTKSDLLMDQLRRVAVFADLQDEDKVCLEGAEEKRIAKGENLVEEGKPAHNFFVLLEGEISVAKAYDGQQIVVARYRPGSFFGELPLLLGVPYIHTARAESASRGIRRVRNGTSAAHPTNINKPTASAPRLPVRARRLARSSPSGSLMRT